MVISRDQQIPYVHDPRRGRPGEGELSYRQHGRKYLHDTGNICC
ncbi:hypothetical protein Ae168Ps1_4001c [Pseudonocardia sp. Ae168_Ps1]|nr:hypothetical protein Ae168Ps1_4001c [Pseudonocardia sp. Ae168_Ps1]OLL84292.1 hypothetical protein Ae263Ps1_1347 [Pseudonocardia sp. Ae263_Ps1]OLL95689.1 hypothetical protein Ae356Ps1_5586c [Pseudonocardia sp. Ae356_Ps1]